MADADDVADMDNVADVAGLPDTDDDVVDAGEPKGVCDGGVCGSQSTHDK